MPDLEYQIQSALFGIAVGDALGVPYEFLSREAMLINPASDMIGFGTHKQEPGTWSDDSSLSFCLAEALTKEFNLKKVADNFLLWYQKGYWTARGSVFDIGVSTQEALSRLRNSSRPDLAGNFGENSNGNGSLMRILPLAFYLQDKSLNERYLLTKAVSSISHGHLRSVLACFYYVEFARLLIKGTNPKETYSEVANYLPQFFKKLELNPKETAYFDRLLKADISELKANQIQSSGYVIHCLEASIWCLLTTGSYSEAVLQAVNLGEDTDTTAAVTGGLAAIYYGYNGIPKHWIEVIARKEDIKDLAFRMTHQLNKPKN
ncbi:ADP-ribosylglycohydrolase family protein [Croceimicrobium sp.]|uniref:ADP-ribosylglycohydrolase family protein n=1 Tax=Croceimicrobium sp. TaxID=2828340 RepID=UPI003BAD4CE1